MRSTFRLSLQVALTVAPIVVAGQTAHSDAMLASPPVRAVARIGVSAGNPWYTAGFQLGYKLGGNASFNDDIVASTRATFLVLNDVFKLRRTRWSLPFVGNVGRLIAAVPSGREDLEQKATELLNSGDGASAEFAPYYFVVGHDTSGAARFSMIAFASVGLRVNAAKNPADSSTIYLGQRRFGTGVEFAVKLHERDPRPFTFSLGPALTWFDRDKYVLATGRARSHIESLEFTMILPVGGFGLLGQTSVASHTRALWRVGVLVAKGN